jgi:hypothetical protein
MAKTTLMIGIGAPKKGGEMAEEMSEKMPGMAPEESEMDPRTASAKAVMSAMKTGNAAKFADALEEFVMNLVGSEDEHEGEREMEEAAPKAEGEEPSPF